MPSSSRAPAWGRRRVLRGVLTAVLGTLVALVALAATAGPVLATGQDTELTGTLRGGSLAEPEIYSGVQVVVTTADGGEVGTATSDEDGRWAITVPGGGEYQVEIVVDSLPEGVGLREGAENPQTVQVDEGGSRGVAVQFGEATTATGFLDRFLPTTLQGFQFGLIIAITAIGLSLIFGTTGLVNFAHGEIVTFAAVLAWFLNAPPGQGGVGWVAAGVVGVLIAPVGIVARDRVVASGQRRGRTGTGSGPGPWWLWAVAGAVVVAGLLWVLPAGMPLLVAGVIAIAASAALGAGLERGLWRPLRIRRTGLITMMVVSIGLSILLRNVLQLWFGGGSQPYFDYTIQAPLNFGPFSATPKELVIIAVSLATLVGVALMLQRTQIGKAMRAVADNRDLAESSGIDVQKVILFTWVLGGGLAGLGGVLSATDENVSFLLGFRLLLLMFAGVILGGLGTAYGALVGSIVIGLITEWSTLFFSAELKIVWGLAVLIVILLVRPQGLLGRKERFG